jgi:hypothetical protein
MRQTVREFVRGQRALGLDPWTQIYPAVNEKWPHRATAWTYILRLCKEYDRENSDASDTQ